MNFYLIFLDFKIIVFYGLKNLLYLEKVDIVFINLIMMKKIFCGLIV